MTTTTKRKRPASPLSPVSDTPKATARSFKVLVNGESCHGGSLTWSLPVPKEDGSIEPGEWHAVTGKIEVCLRGLHLTNKPVNWWKTDARVFEAEYETDDTDAENDDKIAVRRCRLIREVSWDDHQVWGAGEHTVSAGMARAHGSATVEASGSATVRASGSATVRAFVSATVRASGSATVRAFDSATVQASGSATVRAFDSATVEASGSATVRAFGSATVRAFDSATVEASGSATVRAFGSANLIRSRWRSGGWIKLTDAAAVIDRRKDGTVEFHAAPWSDAPASVDAEGMS